MAPPSRLLTFALLSSVQLALASTASATTNQFRGVNWADSRDNFQSGVLYVSGLSSSDSYSSALATGTSVMTQFVSKLGANAVRMPINEATVSGYWSTYTGAIDAVLSKGTVILCYWDSAKTNKPADMNAFWNMWKTVTDKYGGNNNAYFEVFNEPNMYSTSDLISLYTSWLTQFPSVPKSRVVLDGTGDAQNVPNIGSASALDGCLLAVHDYSFFGSDTWTSESQWVSQFKGEVGNYADRTVCTEWGGPMSPGSKNGVSYGSLDYSKAPTNYFEAYIRGMSSQLRAWNMGSFYWAGLKDGDWYSMTTRSGTGSDLVLSVPNQSGLAQLQNAWTGPAPSGGSNGHGGSSGGGSAGNAGGAGGRAGGAGGRAGSGGSGSPGTGGAAAGSGGSGSPGTGGAAAGSSGSGSPGTGGAVAGSGGNPGTGGAVAGSGGSGSPGTGGAAAAGSGGIAGTSTGSGGTSGAPDGRTGTEGPAGSSMAASDSGAGCSCATARDSAGDSGRPGFLLGTSGLLIAAGLRRRRRRNQKA